MPGSTNDVLWKGILEALFGDFLQFVFPRAGQILNIKRGFESLDKELVKIARAPERSNVRIVDRLVKVYQKSGKSQWILCHVEVQGKNQKMFPERMFSYYCRIFARYDRPIIPIAFFTGKDGKKMERIYERRYMGSRMTYKYNTLCILNYSDRRLAQSTNPFALVILTAKKALLKGKVEDNDLLKEKLRIAKLLLSKGYDEYKTIAILTFIHNYIRLETSEMNQVFEKELDALTNKTNTMDIIEQVKQMKIDAAREEGRKEERKKRIEIVKKLLDFGMKVQHIAAATGVSITVVKKLKDKKRLARVVRMRA